MKIDTKARLAVTAMLDIAIHGAFKPVRLADIAKRQRVSVSYLEQLFKRLRHSGLIAGIRGHGGGYQLKQRLTSMTVADIIGAVDGKKLQGDLREAPDNGLGVESSVTVNLWRCVDDWLWEYLRSVTLDSVLASGNVVTDSGQCTPIVVAGPRNEPASA